MNNARKFHPKRTAKKRPKISHDEEDEKIKRPRVMRKRTLRYLPRRTGSATPARPRKGIVIPARRHNSPRPSPSFPHPPPSPSVPPAPRDPSSAVVADHGDTVTVNIQSRRAVENAAPQGQNAAPPQPPTSRQPAEEGSHVVSPRDSSGRRNSLDELVSELSVDLYKL